MTNGTSYGGVIFRDGVYSKTNAYNVSVGTVANTILNPSNGNFAVGVTTDGAKSGIVCTVGASSISSKKMGKYIIKFA